MLLTNILKVFADFEKHKRISYYYTSHWNPKFQYFYGQCKTHSKYQCKWYLKEHPCTPSMEFYCAVWTGTKYESLKTEVNTMEQIFLLLYHYIPFRETQEDLYTWEIQIIILNLGCFTAYFVKDYAIF